MTDLQKCLK